MPIRTFDPKSLKVFCYVGEYNGMFIRTFDPKSLKVFYLLIAAMCHVKIIETRENIMISFLRYSVYYSWKDFSLLIVHMYPYHSNIDENFIMGVRNESESFSSMSAYCMNNHALARVPVV